MYIPTLKSYPSAPIENKKDAGSMSHAGSARSLKQRLEQEWVV